MAFPAVLVTLPRTMDGAATVELTFVVAPAATVTGTEPPAAMWPSHVGRSLYRPGVTPVSVNVLVVPSRSAQSSCPTLDPSRRSSSAQCTARDAVYVTAPSSGSVV